MESTVIQCSPQLVMGSGKVIGGTAIAKNCNSGATPVAISHRRFGFGRTFTSRGGRRAVEKPVAALRSAQRSSPFAGLVESLQEIGKSSRIGVNVHFPVNRLKTVSPIRCLQVNPALKGVNGPSMTETYAKSPQNGVMTKSPVNAEDTNARVSGIWPFNFEMIEPYDVEDKVRDYELDHFGVVNNAVYVHYCQHARLELLQNIGFSPDSVADTGQYLAYSQFTMKFHAPLRSGDWYVVSARLAGTTAARLNFEDFIYKLPERKLVASSKATAVFLNEKYKPTRIPDDVRAKLLEYKARSSPSLSDLNGNSASNNTHNIDGVDQSHVNSNGKLAVNHPPPKGSSATKHPQLNGSPAANLSYLTRNSADVSELNANQPPSTLLFGDRST